MESYFEKQCKELYEKANKIISSSVMFKANKLEEKLELNIPEDFKEEFFRLIDKVNLSLMEDSENFYGYFLFQMVREIRFDISNPTGINFKGAKYVIYFNPIIFLQLDIKQMECTIKHEIHHVLAIHLLRARELKGKASTLAINLSMDIVVNQYLNYLPEYAITLSDINLKYDLELKPFNTLEYYIENIQNALDLIEEDNEGEEDNSIENSDIKSEYDPERTHELWDESSDIDEKTLREFTEKFVSSAEKGMIPNYLEEMINSLKNSSSELPWNLYLKRLIGTVESNKKKTVTRRNRRQPERLDLRGQLRNHKAKVAVAIDISGSISEEEFKQAIKEVIAIIKNYNQEIIIIECDKEIRNIYKVKSLKDIRNRSRSGGGTSFTPVFKYANDNNINLLIYFTDGKGEESLGEKPNGYKVLWIISGRGEALSLKKSYGVVKKLSKVKVKEEILEIKDIKLDGYSMNSQEPIF